MKNHLICLSIILLCSITARAQFKIGVTSGIDYTKLSIHRSTANDYGIQGKAAFRAGLASELKLNEKVYLTADLLFSKKGFQQTVGQEATGKDHLVYQVSDVDVSLNYIEMPVVPQFKVGFKKMNVLFGVGPYLAYGFGGKFEGNIHSGTTTTHFKEDFYWSKSSWRPDEDPTKVIVQNLHQSNIKRFDFGPVVRFGIEFKTISINAEYQYGLPNLYCEWRKYESIHTQRLGLSVKYLPWAKNAKHL